jgi:predicted transcriptional regulator
LVPNPEKRIDMEQIRSHPWVNKNEISMPEVIEPESSGIVTDNDLGKIISSINNDKKHVVYTFNQVKNSKMDPVFALHREGSMTNREGSVKEDKLTVIGVTTRKRSQTVTKGTGGQIVIMTTSSSGKNLTDEVTKNLKQSFPTDESLDQFPTGNTSLFVAPVKGRQRAKSNVVGRSKTTAVFPSLKNIIPETKDSSLGLEATNIVTSPSQSSILASNEKFKRADSILRRMSSVIQSEETTDALKIDVGEINEWHNVHKPPKTIRSSKFMFNSRGSSARLEPATMFQDIHRALMTMQATLPEVQLTFRRVDEYYMFDSKAKDSKGCLMEFTVELCQVWLLNLHAMKIRRTSGDTFLFKDMHDTLLNLIDWKK